MNFLKKLFGEKEAIPEPEEKVNPENTRLNYLLNIWGDHPSDENYLAVMNELLEGKSFLLLPSLNDGKETNGWKTAETGSSLTLTSVFDIDGLKVLGAFSNEKAMLEWAKRPTEYTAMKGSDVTFFCEQHGIDRIVVNSDQKNMFVLERNRNNITTHTIEKDTQVLVGTPAKPLDKRIIEKLIANFQKVESITEAYQYAQNVKGEASIVLGIRMEPVTENSKVALQNAINNSIQGEKLEMPLDVMLLETDDWLKTVQNIEGALFYNK